MTTSGSKKGKTAGSGRNKSIRSTRRKTSSLQTPATRGTRAPRSPTSPIPRFPVSPIPSFPVSPVPSSHYQQAAAYLRRRAGRPLEVAVVLGSGLGEFADQLKNRVEIPYSAIPHFPRSTIEGHVGQLVIGSSSGVSVAAMQGRFHYYEGYAMEQVTFPIRVFGLLGIKSLVLTNATGGINLKFKPGALMLMTDHINFMGVNPLRGANNEDFGPRFPDMSEVYSKRLLSLARREAKRLRISLEEGVYVAVGGPSFETPAEIRAFRSLGGDAVGMSTVPEALVARHMGLEVLGISMISNAAAGVLNQPLDHREVLAMGRRVGGTLTRLLQSLVPKLA
ncbi:MAG: purine-nucleoside phosphorylase [Acidobacteria bacterium]|nr:purine-nucleoside phosphorylase [Acidobacteriota bacterium]